MRKFLICILLLLILASVAQAKTPTFVQQAVATDSVSGQAIGNFSSDPTAGNTYIAIVAHPSAVVTDHVTADDGATTLALIVSSTVSGITTEIWFANNATGESRNFEAVTTVGTISVNMSEWANIKTGTPAPTNSNTGTATTTVTTNSVTATSANSVIIAAGGWTADDYSTGPTNGFTRMTQTGSTGAFQEGAYLIQAGSVARSSGWTLTAGINWASCIAVFNAAPATNAQNSAGFFMGF